MKLAIYDFDGTLTPEPITVLGVLEECGFIGGGNNSDFKKLVKSKMTEHRIDVYKAFYQTIFEIVDNYGYPLNNEVLSIGVENIKYNNGVYKFLEYLYNNNVKNYIISSGIKSFLDKTLISDFFEDIYATTFKYDKNKIVDIDNLMTDYKKVDVIKEIMRINNLKDCSNIIYFGDGLTDIPIMEYIKNNGGITIFVYDDENALDEIKKSNIVSYFFNKDYSLDGDILKKVKEIFDI